MTIEPGVFVKKLLLVPVIALALAPFVANASANAVVEPATVSITVSMDLPSGRCGDGPMVFSVTNVTVGVGPELTGGPSEITSNPCGWRGSVSVDVDNVAQTITVATVDANDFETVTVLVSGTGIDALSVVSDALWQPPAAPGDVEMVLSRALVPGHATIQWDSSIPADYPGLADPPAASVFSFASAEPTTTTTAEVTTTIAPTTTAAPAEVAAVAATPAFTG